MLRYLGGEINNSSGFDKIDCQLSLSSSCKEKKIG